MEGDRLATVAAERFADNPITFAPIAIQPYTVLSRANTVDSESRLSTRSALSALLAAADQGNHIRRTGSSEFGDSDASDAEIADDSQDVHSNDIHSTKGTEQHFSKDAPTGDDGLRRGINGSHSNPHSKSNSRSNSMSQLSLRSASDGSLQRERTARLMEDDGPTSFAENLRCDSYATQSPSANYHNLLSHHQSHSLPTADQHTLASQSARRILSSNSFDSDLSDGGKGKEYAPHRYSQDRNSDLSFSQDHVPGPAHGHAQNQGDFICSDDEYEDEDEEVAEFDEFEDFNAFDVALHRSDSSAGGFGASADTWDDDEYAHGRSLSLPDAAPVTTHELTCKQLMLLVLSTELLFDAPMKTRSKSPATRPPASKNLAAKLLRGSLGLTVQTSRADSDGSIEVPKSILQQNVANAGATGSPKKRRSPLKTSASPRANSFGLNLSGNSLGSGSPRSRSNTGGMSSGRGADDLAVADAERLVRQRLCVYPAEEDGTPMDDLPEYSIATNILRSGLEDFALMDKLTKKCLYQIKLEGRPADFDMYDAEEFAAESAEDVKHSPPPPPAVPAGAQGEVGAREGLARATVGTTVEVLRYDAADAALNPVAGLGPEVTLITTLDRMTSDSARSSDSDTSSGKEGDLRAKFTRARSDSNNDTIRMFRTETDEMLQSKIEEALAAERAAAEAAGGAGENKPKEKKKDRAPKLTVPIEDKNTKYVTVTGRRDESAEFKELLRIPLFDGKPYVTMPSLKPPSPDATISKTNLYTPNSRDIAIATPTKAAPDKNPMSPLGNRGQPRAPSYYPDKDAQVSAALRALQNGGAGGGIVLQAVDYMSDTEVDFRHNSRQGTPHREAAVNRRSLNVLEQQQRITPGHQRNRTFDFAHFSASAATFEVPVPLTPKGGVHPTADAEWRTAAGPSTGPGAPGNRLRNPSFDSVGGGSELPSGYVLNPHTSNRDISFFAIHSGSTPLGTPSATPKKLLSKSSSNNNSNSNLVGMLAESTGQAQHSGADGGYTLNLGPGVAASGSNDVIQLSRRSRSNSILSQSDYNNTQRNSFSSEVSESNHSALHQQLQQAGVVQHNGGSRSSSRPGSVNFFTSANLGGGGFSSDDCSDSCSSSDSEDEFPPRAPPSVEGSPKYDSYGRIRRGKHLSSLLTAHDDEGSGWRRSASASSGSRTPTKKTSPANSAGHSRGSSFGNSDHLNSNLAGKTASSALTTVSGSSASGSTSGSGEEIPDSGGHSAVPAEDNAADVRPPAERSSFYFLSRLFGTFRRSTASNATPRGSAVKIAIIHEAEDEDSDASSSPGGSRKTSPSPPVRLTG